MKFNEAWLRQLVDINVDHETLCDQITMLGLEVDGVEAVAGEFSGVVVGEVVACEQHPNADKLRVTKVNIGNDELLNIVCGAPNCRQGLKVACAKVGAILPGDFKIKPAKLRGEPSEGMLCSFQELGINSEANGIIELPDDAKVGECIRKYLNLDDKIIEISLTPNRSDCLSLRGIAREVAVINKTVVNDFSQNKEKSVAVEPTIDDEIQVNLEAGEACPRYLTRVIKNVDLSVASPLWMQEKLRRCGMRSIDAIVDITNFVMLELGQPMHAFDLAKIEVPISVRMAKDGETVKLLDGNTATLKDNTLVIADNKEVLAMAGIFGGENSGINLAETKDIVLEAAFFAPLAITGRARQYGLHTESSHRFERGVDYNLPREAMERASELVLRICGGEAGKINEVVDSKNLPSCNKITLRRSRLDKILGHHVENRAVSDILERLGLNPKFENNKNGSNKNAPQGISWTVTSPSFRFDLEIEEDLIEEVARIYGYNSIPNKAPLANLKMNAHLEAKVDLNQVKQILVGRDYQEAITYSFVDPKIQKLFHEEDALMLPNPISSEMSAMRLSLVSGLLGALSYNQNRQQNRVRLFESGLKFTPVQDNEIQVEQKMVLAAVITGSKNNPSWDVKAQNVDFFDLKGDLESLFALSDARDEIKFVAKDIKGFHPTQTAQLIKAGKQVGFIGAIHPSVCQKLDINNQTYYFEVELDAILHNNSIEASPISKYPTNKRDLAFVVSDLVPTFDILAKIKAVNPELVKAVNLFDLYKGENIATDAKSLAVSVFLQDNNKTLTEDNILEVLAQIRSMLTTDFDAIFRE